MIFVYPFMGLWQGSNSTALFSIVDKTICFHCSNPQNFKKIEGMSTHPTSGWLRPKMSETSHTWCVVSQKSHTVYVNLNIYIHGISHIYKTCNAYLSFSRSSIWTSRLRRAMCWLIRFDGYWKLIILIPGLTTPWKFYNHFAPQKIPCRAQAKKKQQNIFQLFLISILLFNLKV